MYSDSIDFASELEQRERDHAAAFRKPEMKRTGKCNACEARLGAAQALFCDSDCQEDYKRMRESLARSGKTIPD